MDYSRQAQCNNLQGGNNRLYVMPFVDYLDNQITVMNNVLTNFPNTDVYKIDSFNLNFNIEGDNDLYDEKISFQLKKSQETDYFKNFISQDFRLILKTNNNKYRFFGLKTGLIGNYKEESGTNKNDFSGYSFNFQTKEEQSAPYLNDLSFFNIIDTINIISLEMTFNTYAEMIIFGTPKTPINARVLEDENKGIENSTYILYPDGERLWVASTSDN